MNLLDQIVAAKKKEVAERKQLVPVKQLESSPYFNRVAIPFTAHIQRSGGNGIIAEFKRRSPSEGILHATADAANVTSGYARYGAAALSVLTDAIYFGGSTADLIAARACSAIPILRKDFIVDPYQVWEAKAMGADLVLLIAASLTTQEVRDLAQLAKGLGMQVLLEIHSREELEALNPWVDAIGVNNRNLKTFTTDLHQSVALAPLLPQDLARVSESGIHTPEDIRYLKSAGFNGFLVGSLFMRQAAPELAFAEFIKALDHAS